MIKSYKMFLEASSYEDDVAAICKRYGIKNWVINPDTGLVDVDGNVNFHDMDLTKIPLNFGKVSGNFTCAYNKLTTLEGCPREVSNNFSCSENKLNSLIGCPNSVRNFSCSANKITSLEGCPQKVDENFWCYNNHLTNLFGIGKVGKLLNCRNNKIVNLEGLNNNYPNSFIGINNPIRKLSEMGNSMIDHKISFLESAIMNEVSDRELELILSTIIDAQKLLDLNNFRVFNFLRIHLPEKYKEVMSLRNVDLSADLGELGF